MFTIVPVFLAILLLYWGLLYLLKVKRAVTKTPRKGSQEEWRKAKPYSEIPGPTALPLIKHLWTAFFRIKGK